MDFFKKEELVYLNNIKVSENGFKNLTFETSKFSNSNSAIRGFGSSLDENNLNTVDTINLEFLIDASELSNIALIYTMFKALGALPLTNRYIQEKIKGSLNVEQSIVDFKKPKDLKKDIKSLIVFLEQLKITSIEKTNNGFSVFMRLSLHKNGFNDIENTAFNNLFEQWNKETHFSDICLSEILKEQTNIKQPRMFELKIYNVEKLNALLKEKVILSSNLINADENDINKKNIYYNNLKKYEDLDKHYVLRIDEKHITQIELITTNIISEIPIQGNSIGIKSYMGPGQSYYNLKLILDEGDKELISEIKSLSDKNISNHKIEITHSLANMFDFHSASIKSIIFNNIESMNGVMITVQLQINSYNVFSIEQLNPNNLTQSAIVKNDYHLNNIGYYLETIIKFLLSNSLDSNEQILQLLNAIIQSEAEHNDMKNKRFFIAKFGDFLSMYSSQFSSYLIPKSSIGNREYIFRAKLKTGSDTNKANYLEYLNKEFNNSKFKFKYFLNQLSSKEIDNSFDSREFSIESLPLFYNFVDLISFYSIIPNEEVKKELKKELNHRFEAMHKVLFKDLFNFCFSIDISNNDPINTLIEMIYYKEFFLRAYDSINFGPFSSILKEIQISDFYTTKNSLNFKKIYKILERLIDAYYQSYIESFQDENFKERIKNEIISIYSSGTNKDIESETVLAKQINEYSSELYSEYRKIYEDTHLLIKHFTYNVFLTKFTFLIVSCFGSDEALEINRNINDFSEVVKSFIISASLFGFFSYKGSNRVDNFSNVYKEASFKLSEYLNIFYNFLLTNDKEFKEESLEKFKNYVPDSYWGDKLQIKNTEIENKYNFLINKDYNYFYGKKIENKFPEKFINSSLIDKYVEESKITCSDFLNEYKEKFKNENEHEEFIRWVPFKIKMDTNSKMLTLPSLNKIMHKGKSISQVMKKRIIGNRDLFSDFNKIAEIVNSDSTETIPDYHVLIKSKAYDNDNSGMYKAIELNKIISMNNLVNLSISKNSTTKIKTAIVNFIDFNKEIIEYYGDSSIGVLNPFGDGIKLLKIEPGNEIEIYMGYSDNSKMVYKGFVDKIEFKANILSLQCVDSVSMLYNYKINQLLFGDNGTWKETANRIMKLVLSDGIKVKPITMKNEFSRIINNHLFDYRILDHNPFSDFGTISEASSAYNVFGTLIYKMPIFINKEFNSFYISNRENLLILNMKEKMRLNQMFGNPFDTDNSDLRNLDFPRNIICNLNNIDRDYETYGLDNDLIYVDDERWIENENKKNKKKSKENNKEYGHISEQSKINLVTTPLFELSKDMCMPTESNKVTSIYGEARKGNRIHQGVDIKNNKGLKLFAPLDCEVITNSFSQSYGNQIELYNQKEKLKFKFAHLAERSNLKVGEQVTKGSIVGIMGNTGRSYGVHLHLEVFKNGERIDPLFLFGFKNFVYEWESIGQTALRMGGTARMDIINYKNKVLEMTK